MLVCVLKLAPRGSIGIAPGRRGNGCRFPGRPRGTTPRTNTTLIVVAGVVLHFYLLKLGEEQSFHSRNVLYLAGAERRCDGFYGCGNTLVTSYKATSNLWAKLSDSPEVQHCDRYWQWGFMCGSGRMTSGLFELRKREKVRARGHDVRGEAGLDMHIEPTERRG